MNTMKMPGFTAENALSESGRKYNIGAASSTEISTSGVIPQAQFGGGLGEITIEPEQCDLRCRWRCGRYGCYPTDCYWVCY
jgi:hypothetical protein